MSTEITSEFVWHSIPPRPRDSHKGSFGTVLAVAGSAYYRGAALLAAEGALRTGAGIVTLASVEPVLAAAVARLPECCLCPCVVGAEGGISPESIPQLQRQKATVLLLGPGLGGTAQSTGRAAETRTLVQKLLPGFAGSAVLDADGLNAAAQLLAEGKTLPHPAGELIVTPHPGEMARLTGLSVAQINADRENTACQYAEKWNAVVVLKGCRTVVAAPLQNTMSTVGNMMGPMGMLLAGMAIAEKPLREVFCTRRNYLPTVLRLVVCPLVVLVLLWVCHASSWVADGKNILMTVYLAAITPACATVTSMAQLYNRDAAHSSALYVLTTLLSIVSMPVMIGLFDLLL